MICRIVRCSRVEYDGQLIVSNNPRQTVARQEELITGPGIAPDIFDLEFLVYSDGARNQICVLVRFRFLWFQHAGINQILNHAVIMCHAADLAAAKSIGTAVSHPEASE